MEFPPGFDPSAVTVFALNSCHFTRPEDLARALARLKELFPNATPETYLFHEDLRLCLLRLEPRQVADAAYSKLFRTLEKHISPGGPAGTAAPSWQPGDSEAWKDS